MDITIREARPDEVEALVPLLLQAEPFESSLRWSLGHLSDAVYRMDHDGELVGAVTMRWSGPECEIVELAVAANRHGQGLGRRLVGWVVDEARRRAKAAVVVGTGNASIGNIVFYQRCGFRMDHVRPDYFWYYGEPVVEHGIVARDMLVFRLDLDAGAAAGRRGRRAAR
jgi:GNAT superfamily N-acetyltransferase